MDAIDALNQIVWRYEAAHRTVSRQLGGADRRARAALASQSIRPACRSSSIPSTRMSGCRSASAALAAAAGPGVVRTVMPQPALLVLDGGPGAVRRQLSQRLHLPAAARRIARAARRRAVRTAASAWRWFDNIPVVSWLVLARPLPPVRRADLDPVPDRRTRHGAARRAGRAGHAAGTAPRQPARAHGAS